MLRRLITPAIFIALIGAFFAIFTQTSNATSMRDTVRATFLADQQGVEILRAPAVQAATACEAGSAAGFPCNGIDLMAHMPLGDIGGGSGSDMWGWIDPVTNKPYAIMTRNAGTSFVDISDPENPIYVGQLRTHTTSTSWRDVKTYQNHAFIVSESPLHGMQVFDLTQLRSVTSTPANFSNTAHYGGVGSAHNIFINEESGVAYIIGASGRTQSGCSGGLHMVDISTPASPSFLGCFSADGYTHDVQCVMYDGPDTDHTDKEICFASNEDTLTIVDVTNKAAPQQLSRIGYSGSRYTHQGWLTDDSVYFLMNDEVDESTFGHGTRTYIWNVSNLDNPVLEARHTASTPAIDHNNYIKDGLVYQANYRAGLRVLDLENIASGSLEEIRYFDVYAANNNASYNGAWSVYPYFEDNIIGISSIEGGLFIVKMQPPLDQDIYLPVLTTQSVEE